MSIKFSSNDNSFTPKYTSNEGSFTPTFNADGSLRITTDSSDQIIPISFASDPVINLDFGSVVTVDGQGKEKQIYYGSTEYWNSQPKLKTERGCLYIYRDWIKTEDDRYIAGIKVGDGTSYLIDMPFTDQLWNEHIQDMVRHITQEEREFWNNKVRCYIPENDTSKIIFTTN